MFLLLQSLNCLDFKRDSCKQPVCTDYAVNLMEVLLQHGADVNAADKQVSCFT